MPEWLTEALANGPVISATTVALRLLVSLVLGYLVALLYLRSSREADTGGSFPITLVLLCILIAMVTQVIGNNIARAFSLVGTLSIVRFRTVVRDTRDTAFVIFAVVVGMAVGSANLWVALIGMVVVAAASLLLPLPLRAPVQAATVYLLRLRVPLGQSAESIAGTVLDEHLEDRELTGMATNRPGVSIDFNYEARLKPERMAQELVRALSMLEGVQDVRLERRPADRI